MGEDSQERAVGRLEGKMDSIIATLERNEQSRKAMYDKIDLMAQKVVTADLKIDGIDKRLQTVEEPVAEFKQWRERGIGALMLISFVAATVGGLIATFGKKIWAAIVGP